MEAPLSPRQLRLCGQQNRVVEIAFQSEIRGRDAFLSVDLDLIVRSPDGTTRSIPGFWIGDRDWRVRYSSPVNGTHSFTTISNDANLGRYQGEIEITRDQSENPLFRHGPLIVAGDDRHLMHADGMPFLWLADTWWYAFVKRISRDDFQALAFDRSRCGFSVIQLVAGLYPEMRAFDASGDGEHGWPWLPAFECINPEWWEDADRRLEILVEAGLVPCVVGSWGYYMHWMGRERMKRHWRYITARWGAHPVVWCVGGETRLPWYDDVFTDRAAALSRDLAQEWSDVRDYIHDVDGFQRLVTAHPGPADGSWSTTDVFFGDRSGSDVVMLQTGHWDKESLHPSVETLKRELRLQPPRPVLNGEVCYEGIVSSNWQETQRFLFWSHLLTGAAGHSYGAQGLWSFETLPGSVWGDSTWQQAADLDGARQLGLAADFLRSLPWELFEAHPEWIDPHADSHDWRLPYAAGVPGELRVFYLPGAAVVRVRAGDPVPFALDALVFHALEPGRRYRAYWFDPRRGKLHESWDVRGDENGDFKPPDRRFLAVAPSLDDWVLVFDAREPAPVEPRAAFATGADATDDAPSSPSPTHG